MTPSRASWKRYSTPRQTTTRRGASTRTAPLPERDGAGRGGAGSYVRPLIFAARTKSFSDRPPIACVVNVSATLFHEMWMSG